MKRTLLLVAAVLMTFALYSCDKENMAGVDVGTEKTQVDYFVQLDETDNLNDVYDATLETDMHMSPAPFEGSMMMHKYKGNKKDKTPPSGKRFFKFGEIFREMNLSEEQIALIPDIISNHYLCIFDAKLALRAALEDIFTQARADRLEIITAFRNGNITRDEAKAQLQTLNETTRETIQNSEAHAAFETVMCACFNEMIESIEEMLDATQLEQWNTWLETTEHPCLD